MLSVEHLPDDPVLLKQMLARECAVRNEQLAQRDAIIVQRDAAIEQIKREAAETIEAMTQRHKAEIDAILRRFYGPKSEKFDPRQLLIFGIAVAEQVPVDEKVVEAEAGEKLATRRINGANGHHRHGRRKLPDHLPRVEVVHDLSDDEKKCPCCGEMRACIGSETSEQLEYVPASFKVLKHVRHKYACNACGNGCTRCDCNPHIQIATKEAQPIEKGLPGPGLLAYVIVSKLGDHLPLYRLERIFDRHGVDIARSTMCAWMLSASELVKPLIERMTTRVKQSQVIHTDETRVPVQERGTGAARREGQCRQGRIWTYLGDESNPYVVYDYTPDRTRAGPQRFLADYKGYLQADAYGGYDGIYHKGLVTEVACWAHARRKFFDAKETDGRRAAEMLRLVGRLYRIERAVKLRIEKQLKNQPDGAKAQPAWPRDQQHEFVHAMRQKRSVPVLAKIKTWLDREKELVLPRSPMAQAINYTLNQWDALNRYVEQGYLNIDNNAAERALKRVAIGRKNWLFAGHDESGASHARLYTLIASAERHGIDPQRYLTSVLTKIGQARLSELEQFLPNVWKRDDAAEPTHRPCK